MSSFRLTALDIEVAVARYFGWRRCLIVPNVSWGWNLSYEADMIVLKGRWAYEVEIKVSKADLKRDVRKWKWLKPIPLRIRGRYFAVPSGLGLEELIPADCGVFVLGKDQAGHPNGVKLLRQPKINKIAIPVTPEQRLKLAELGAMRVWSLKEHGRNRDCGVGKADPEKEEEGKTCS